jgi:DNA-binding response OmpR family regulator
MPDMARARVLVIEDDARTAGWLQLYLEREGLEAEIAADGAQGLAALRSKPANLVLLDLMLPGLDGFALCRAIRAESDVPIIVVTARAAEDDRLRGFELGADDYVTKPFSPREVIARVRAVLRRSSVGDDNEDRVSLGGVTLKTASLAVEGGDRSVRVTPIECRLLTALMRAPGRVFTRAELVTRAIGDGFDGSERTVDAHVKNVRRKLATLPDAPAIETIHGSGYRLIPHAPAP